MTYSVYGFPNFGASNHGGNRPTLATPQSGSPPQPSGSAGAPNPYAGITAGLANSVAGQTYQNAVPGQMMNALQGQQGQQMAAFAAMHAPAPAPVKPIENAGIKLGEIIAFRVWRIEPNGFLRSAYVGTIWAPGEIQSGEPGKGHGIHAWKTQSLMLEYGLDKGPAAYGKVELWGDVIEHERGWRAEHAKIVSIDGVLNTGTANAQIILSGLRERYGLPA